MQVMPAFCYLLPCVLLFDIGYPPAVIATVDLRAAGRDPAHAARARAACPTGWSRSAPRTARPPRQSLWKIQLPVARPALLLGVNQTINLALGIVVIAALVGAEGLGQEVLNGLQHLDVGQAFDAGLAIVAVAIVLDRHDRRPAAARARARSGATARPNACALELIVGVAVVAIAVVVGKIWSGRARSRRRSTSRCTIRSTASSSGATNNLRNGIPIIGGTAAISDFVVHPPARPDPRLPRRPRRGGRSSSASPRSRGRPPAGASRSICAIALLVVAGLHAEGTDSGSIWIDTMDTLSQVLVAVVLVDADRAAGRHHRRAAATASTRRSDRSSTRCR